MIFETLAEAIINRLLRLDPQTLVRLGELEGKLIRVDLGTMTFHVEPVAEGLKLHRNAPRAPDVTLRGSVPVFARLARTGIAVGELQISGDIEVGSRFQRILKDVELDWEEPLSRVVGDVAAHQIGRAVRGATSWGIETSRTVAQDVVEYLQEERRVLAPRVRVEDFMQSVDKLRADADRLEKRIELLQRPAR